MRGSKAAAVPLTAAVFGGLVWVRGSEAAAELPSTAVFGGVVWVCAGMVWLVRFWRESMQNENSLTMT